MTNKNHLTIKCFESSFKNTTNLNHGVHSYPAKFPPQIPEIILNSYATKDYVVLDPFCGSGTTMVEASLLDLNSIGNDINPIALLISRVKTTYYDGKDIDLFRGVIEDIKKEYSSSNIANVDEYEAIQNFHGRDHWFQKNVQYEIELILKHIDTCKDTAVNDLLKVTLSEILIAVSNQESDTRYASKDKSISNGFTIETFIKKAKDISEKVKMYSDHVMNNTSTSKVISNDARDMVSIKNDSVDIIITSPPYANTYDYYLYHKHRMNWLGYNFKETQKAEIGSRHEYSSKKIGGDKWEEDLFAMLQEMQRVLKSDRYAFIVIGDSVINKELIEIDKVIKIHIQELGLELINIESTPMSKNSRKFNKKFGTTEIKMEHLIQVYKK